MNEHAFASLGTTQRPRESALQPDYRRLTYNNAAESKIGRYYSQVVPTRCRACSAFRVPTCACRVPSCTCVPAKLLDRLSSPNDENLGYGAAGWASWGSRSSKEFLKMPDINSRGFSQTSATICLASDLYSLHPSDNWV